MNEFLILCISIVVFAILGSLIYVVCEVGPKIVDFIESFIRWHRKWDL